MSKTLAEKAAWEFCNENGIDLVTVLPSFVIGPCLPPDLCSTASDVLGLLKGSLFLIRINNYAHFFLCLFHGYQGYDMYQMCSLSVYFYFNQLSGEAVKFQWHGRMGYVHIDDVALCHIFVYEHKSASGRYLCSSTVLDNNELASFLSSRYPSLPIPKRLVYCKWALCLPY